MVYCYFVSHEPSSYINKIYKHLKIDFSDTPQKKRSACSSSKIIVHYYTIPVLPS